AAHEGNGRRRGLPVAQERARGRRQHGCGTHRQRVGAVRWRVASPARGSRGRALHRRGAAASHRPQLRLPLIVANLFVRRHTGIMLAVAFAMATVLVAATRLRMDADNGRPPNASTRFAELDEHTPENASRLATAWTAHTGDFPGGDPHPTKAVKGFQTRPALVGELLIVTTTVSRVIALDAETGVERWRFDPFAGRTRSCELPNRGVAVWEHRTSGGDRGGPIFSGPCDGLLVAVDPATGKLRQEFADGGVLDLKPGADASPGEQYAVTSPPAIFRDLEFAGLIAPDTTCQG